MGILKDCILRDDFESKRWELVPAHLNFIHFCNDHDEKTDLPDIWKQNIETNIKWFDKNKRISVHDMPDYSDKAVILVGASPVIKKTWKYLKNIDDRFIVVAVNSVAKYLIDRKIKVDYIICVDGQMGEWTLDLGEKAKDITAIFSVSAPPEVLQKWPGNIMVLPYKYAGMKNLGAKIKRRWGDFVPAGGNAFNAAFAVFLLISNSKIYVFCGNELSWSKTYYAQGFGANDRVPFYFATDTNGKEVKTLIPLYNYKIWLEHVMCMTWPKCVFYNCSNGILGVDVNGKHLPYVYNENLENVIEMIKEAFEFEKQTWQEKQQVIYEDAYAHRGYHPTNSKNIWPAFLDQIVPFEKGLDVGCGEGEGMKIALDAGFNVYGIDIVDLDEIWKKNGVRDRCIQAPAHKMPFEDNEFDFVLCSETMEHIPTEGIDETLNEIVRVCSDRFIFTIALSADNAYWEKGVTYHSTLEKPEWWLEKLKKAGIEAAIHGMSELPKSLIIYGVKDKNKYQSGEKQLFIPGFESSEDYLFSMKGIEIGIADKENVVVWGGEK